MPEFVLPGHIAQALMEYLSTKPYREVAQLLAALQQLRQLPNPESNSGSARNDKPIADTAIQ